MRAVAIINADARGLRGPLRRRLEQALPGRVRVTASLAEARTAIREEIPRGLDLVILGGGDGTVVMGLTLVAEACRGAGRPEPAIGVLRLGGANALADAVGATDDAVEDLAALARGRGTWRRVPMLDVLGLRAPYVGVGIDAQLLEDRDVVERAVERVPGARRLVGDGARRVLALALRSAPRIVREVRLRATVVNAGAPAIEMARGGATGREVARGGVLWTGPYTLLAAGTLPYLGRGLQMFPFAGERSDRFQLRCGDAGWLELVRNASAARRGEYFSRHVTDFLCERVTIELDREGAIEVGGELLGRRRTVELGLTAPVTLVSLA